MARMGLKMHVGTGSIVSKTEAIYFPSRSKITSWLLNHESLQISSYRETFSLVEAGKKEKRIMGDRLKKMIGDCYEKAVETDNIIVQSVNFISFTKVFKYLGSWIEYNLCDEYDILQRIKKANQAMGTLNFFWNTDLVDLHDKYKIFMAVPLNLLLWACESWAITKK